MAEHWLSVIGADVRGNTEYIVNSCPAFLPRVPAPDMQKLLANCVGKSYNLSQKEWYYGLKTYTLVARKPNRLPVPLSVMVSGTAQHNLPIAKQIMGDCLYLKQGRLYADKAYANAVYAKLLKTIMLLNSLPLRKNGKWLS